MVLIIGQDLGIYQFLVLLVKRGYLCLGFLELKFKMDFLFAKRCGDSEVFTAERAVSGCWGMAVGESGGWGVLVGVGSGELADESALVHHISNMFWQFKFN